MRRYFCQTTDAAGEIKTEDVTDIVNELIRASKELASIVIANKIVIDDIMNNLKGKGNGQGTEV